MLEFCLLYFEKNIRASLGLIKVLRAVLSKPSLNELQAYPIRDYKSRMWIEMLLAMKILCCIIKYMEGACTKEKENSVEKYSTMFPWNFLSILMKQKDTW